MGIKTAKFGGMSSIAGAPGLEPGVSGFGDRYVTNYTIPLFHRNRTGSPPKAAAPGVLPLH